MISYKYGDVILIPFPFTDFTTLKQRPALVVSSSEFNATYQDVIVVAITSHIPDQLTTNDFMIHEKDQKSAGLPRTSLVKLGKIVTVDKRLIRRKLGSLPFSAMKHITVEIHRILSDVPPSHRPSEIPITNQ